LERSGLPPWGRSSPRCVRLWYRQRPAWAVGSRWAFLSGLREHGCVRANRQSSAVFRDTPKAPTRGTVVVGPTTGRRLFVSPAGRRRPDRSRLRHIQAEGSHRRGEPRTTTLQPMAVITRRPSRSATTSRAARCGQHAICLGQISSAPNAAAPVARGQASRSGPVPSIARNV
jgi:hypothetical protein